MATVGGSNLTMLEWAKRVDPNGTFYEIAEILSKKNAIIQDALWKEANMKLMHLMSVRDYLPKGAWKSFYGSTPVEVSGTRQITEHVGMLRGFSEVDKDEAEISGNVDGFRSTEDKAFLEGLMQTFADVFFYGSQATDPAQFNGLATRLSTLNSAASPVPGKAQGAGGTTASKQTSAYIVKWDENAIFGLYPTGSEGAGMVKSRNNGLVQVSETVNGVRAIREVYQSAFEINGGIAIKDPRYIHRVANIEVGTTGWWTEANIRGVIKNISQCLRAMPEAGAGAVIYVNNDFLAMMDTYMDLKTGAATNITYERGEIGNLQVAKINGCPVKVCENILSTEAVVA